MSHANVENHMLLDFLQRPLRIFAVALGAVMLQLILIRGYINMLMHEAPEGLLWAVLAIFCAATAVALVAIAFGIGALLGVFRR